MAKLALASLALQGAAQDVGAAPVSAPSTPTASVSTETVVSAPTVTPPRLVVAHTYGLNFGLSGIPSGEVSLFLGGALPIRPRRDAHWTSLGVQQTFGGGFVDGSLGDRLEPRGLLAYRLHLTVHGVAGPAGRLFYASGVGPVFLLLSRLDPVGNHDFVRVPPGVGLEAEGRIGLVFARRSHTRIRGVVGLQVRLSGVFRHAVAPQPLPQFGVFLGFHRAPVAIQAREIGATEPRRGVGLLVPGVLLIAVGVFTMTLELAALNQDEACHGCVPVSSYLTPITLAAGIPMTVVGATRFRRHREWQQRWTLTPRAAGLAVKF